MNNSKQTPYFPEQRAVYSRELEPRYVSHDSSVSELSKRTRVLAATFGNALTLHKQ